MAAGARRLQACAATVAGYGCRLRLHACERVSTAFRQTPEFEFQKRMVRSAVPPPEVRRLRCHGHQAMALTAATWRSSRKSGWPAQGEGEG